MELTAFLVGGTIAAGTHATKAGARVMINTSPEPFTNWTASISEDILVIGGIWTAINHPIVFLVGLLIFFCVMLWLLPKLWRGIRQLINSVRNLFNPNSANNEAQLIEPPETQPDG